ncbi:Tapt1 family [Dillenia turbinata]|uniref:Tapt1 family n=1 Tax=Dillenia turbinata TaxID=194707 RepID=A0AAN8ZEA1_9MAGN
MGLKSGGRNLSFEILSGRNFSEDEQFLFPRSNSDSKHEIGGDNPNRRKRKNKKKKKSNNNLTDTSIDEYSSTDKRIDFIFNEPKKNGWNFRENFSIQTVICEETKLVQADENNARTVDRFSEPENQSSLRNGYVTGELRQRSVNGGSGVFEESKSGSGVCGNVEEENIEQVKSSSSGSGMQRVEPNANAAAKKLETAESLDWKKLMAEDPSYHFSVEKSPLKYFMEGLHKGNSLRSTTSPGSEKERERVYDTIFRLPWRCELVIPHRRWLLCLHGFVSIFVNHHANKNRDNIEKASKYKVICVHIGYAIFARYTNHTCGRQFMKPCAAELSDFGCFIVMICGVGLLQQTDISLIYHMIRGQGIVKLYVVYNVLEIFDKLCQSFGGEVLETLFNTAEGLANCSPENTRYWVWRFISDLALAVGASNILYLVFFVKCQKLFLTHSAFLFLNAFILVHSFILLAQAVTLSTCIVAHNNALLAMLISNNFAEIKSSVFKRFSKDNVHSLVYFDSVERFHISAYILFVLAQNILEAEGPWFESFFSNVLMVFMCEMAIDIIKHSFIAKFNDIKPIAYSEFLEDLCKQTLNIQTEDAKKKNLAFVPLAPACVVIRVLTPVFASHLPCGPFPLRLFWIFLLSFITFVMLASLKVMVGLALQKHAAWYVQRCQKRKHHLHFD